MRDTFPVRALRPVKQEFATLMKGPLGGYRPRQRMTVREHLPDMRCRFVWFEVGQYTTAVFHWSEIEFEHWKESGKFGDAKYPKREFPPLWKESFPIDQLAKTK